MKMNSSFKKAMIVSILLLTGSKNSHAVQDGFKLQSATFNFDSVTNTENSDTYKVDAWAMSPLPPVFGNNGFYGASIQRDRTIKGSIVIEEYNENELVQRITKIENVFLKMSARGVTFGAKAIWNGSLTISGLENHTVQDIFNSKYRGWKAGIGVGVVVGLNPNYMNLSNSNGITISDFESMLAITGAGLQVIKIKAEFTTIANQPVVYTVQSTATNQPIQKPVSLDDLKNRVF